MELFLKKQKEELFIGICQCCDFIEEKKRNSCLEQLNGLRSDRATTLQKEETISRGEETISRGEETISRGEETISRTEETISRAEETISRAVETVFFRETDDLLTIEGLHFQN